MGAIVGVPAYAAITYTANVSSPYQQTTAPVISALITGAASDGTCTPALSGTTYTIPCTNTLVDGNTPYTITTTINGVATGNTPTIASSPAPSSETLCGTFSGSGTGPYVDTCTVTPKTGGGTATFSVNFVGP